MAVVVQMVARPRGRPAGISMIVFSPPSIAEPITAASVTMGAAWQPTHTSHCSGRANRKNDWARHICGDGWGAGAGYITMHHIRCTWAGSTAHPIGWPYSSSKSESDPQHLLFLSTGIWPLRPVTSCGAGSAKADLRLSTVQLRARLAGAGQWR